MLRPYYSPFSRHYLATDEYRWEDEPASTTNSAELEEDDEGASGKKPKDMRRWRLGDKETARFWERNFQWLKAFHALNGHVSVDAVTAAHNPAMLECDHGLDCKAWE